MIREAGHKRLRSVAEALDVYSFMLSRWCKEGRDGHEIHVS